MLHWLATEWTAVRPNIEASLLWAPVAWLYARWHVKRLHRKMDALHRKVDQRNEER